MKIHYSHFSHFHSTSPPVCVCVCAFGLVTAPFKGEGRVFFQAFSREKRLPKISHRLQTHTPGPSWTGTGNWNGAKGRTLGLLFLVVILDVSDAKLINSERQKRCG